MLIAEQCSDVWSINFISGKPSGQGYNTIFTCIDKFIKFAQIVLCFKVRRALSAPERANLFFFNIIRLFGIPKMVLHDRDSRCMSNFWKALWEFLGTKVLFTSAYKP